MSQDVPGDFSARAIRGRDDGYLAFHAPRYAHVLRLLARHGVDSGTRLLDIGPSHLTELIHHRFGCQVDSLGFGPDRATEYGRHHEFDLNRSQYRRDWRDDLGAYEVVVMAEVIEHLHTAPQLVLGFVRRLLIPGGLLLLQTPNAAGLSKRIKLLLGRNPFDPIREDVSNPGHFREYTLAELHDIAAESGFRVERTETSSYFDMRFGLHTSAGNRPRPYSGALKNVIYRVLPRSLRFGITMECRAR